MKRQGSAFLLAALLWTAPAHAREQDLVDPAPIEVPAARTPAEVSKTLHEVFARHGWVVAKDEAGHAVMTYKVPEHSVSVSVDYSGPAITIGYLDSTAMNYSEDQGHRRIHPKYNIWVADVAGDLAYALGSGVPADMATLRPVYDSAVSISPVTIHYIDHEVQMPPLLRLRNSHPKPSYQLTPGKHVIGMSCADFHSGRQTQMVGRWLVAAPGARYRAECRKISDDTAQLYLVDEATGAPVGGVVGSDDEPKGGN